MQRKGVRSILEMSSQEARAFLLKDTSFCGIDLPPYIQFQKILNKVAIALQGKNLTGCKSSDKSKHPHNFDDVNYSFITNKDGKYAWRPFEIIHPALYVSLVNEITSATSWPLIIQRFADFRQNNKIRCISIPVESLTSANDKASQVLEWWHDFEQESISLALDFQYMFTTDISDCYGAIYTHSIAWALHTKSVAKEKRNDEKLIGNIIDRHIQDMRNGQTNGIPQGSVLMDFIAEIVLGYADQLLSERLKKEKVSKYLILRYRDDCRIFVNNPQDGERVMKSLTEILISLGLKLHPGKTQQASCSIVTASLKNDKLAWLKKKQGSRNLEKHSLIIHQHSVEYPNSGSLVKALSSLYKRILMLRKCLYPTQLISIIVDIAINNPRTYPICAAIISKLLQCLPRQKQVVTVNKIFKKFSLIPNTGYMEVWLQRAVFNIKSGIKFRDTICQLVCDDSVQLWNSDWIADKKIKQAMKTKIINKRERDNIPSVIAQKEVILFLSAVYPE